jgi:hypothetical protein
MFFSVHDNAKWSLLELISPVLPSTLCFACFEGISYMSVKFLPATKTRKVLSNEELNNKLASRARTRKDSWPLENEDRPVLIRTFAALEDRSNPPRISHDVDNSPIKGTPGQAQRATIQRVPSATKRLRDDDIVERVSTHLK